MEQLRLAGVHDDGEHLVVEDQAGGRHLLRIDQELRLAVQRARRLPGSRRNGGGQFGPREIQARFRAGATVDEIVAESGWEAARVRRYEWPILAERAHIAAEAQKVELDDPSAHRGYHSVFEGEPLSLGRTVAHRARGVGVDPSSLEWDSWQREDQLWAVVARFTVVEPETAPTGEPSPAEWVYNPANQSVRPSNAWAEALTQPERPDTPLATGLGVLDGGLDPELTRLRRSAVEADDLLDVLQARRGQRIGEDTEGDDALAELLGRGMGHVEHRPRPLAAPEDSPVFDRPFQPATSFTDSGAAPAEPETEAEPQTVQRQRPAGRPAAGQDAEAGEVPAGEAGSTTGGQVPDGTPDAATGADERSAPDGRGAVAPPAGAEPGTPDSGTPQPERAEPEVAEPEAAEPEAAESNGVAPESSESEGAGDPDAEPSAPERPRPRNRTAKARRSNRSSVPSWDEIVFGSSSD